MNRPSKAAQARNTARLVAYSKARKKTGATVDQGGAGDVSEPPKAFRIIWLPIITVSTLNTREHWAKRAKRTKEHRQFAAQIVMWLKLKELPTVVTLIRTGPRQLDGDNLQGALKAVRDGVADGLGIDDADPRVKWEYRQEKGVAGVRVEMDK